MFFEISQNSKENSCARISFLIKLQASACNFTKKETLVFSCGSFWTDRREKLFQYLFSSIKDYTLVLCYKRRARDKIDDHSFTHNWNLHIFLIFWLSQDFFRAAWKNLAISWLKKLMILYCIILWRRRSNYQKQSWCSNYFFKLESRKKPAWSS